MRLLCLSIFLVLSVCRIANSQTPDILRLATTDWCPYSCAEKEGQKGIVFDYIEALLARHSIKLEVESFPWSRAIALAERGDQFSGLLTAVPTEAEGFLLTRIPIASYQVCFFVRGEQNWRYVEPISLSLFKGRLGYFADYGYGEPIDSYLQNPELRERLIAVAGGAGLMQLMRLLKAKRIDAFVEDINIVRWTLGDNLGDGDQRRDIKKAGCLEPRPFYLAINPEKPWAKSVVELLNRELADPENEPLFHKISEAYLGKILF